MRAPRFLRRRAPLFRVAALFCLAAALLAPASATSAFAGPSAGALLAGNARGGAARSAPATIKIGSVAYTEAAGYFARLGYQASLDKEAHFLTLKSPAGQIVLEIDSREARLHGLRVFLGEPVVVNRGTVYVATLDLERFLGPILRPTKLKPRPLRTIVIDAGHGGTDTGTRHAGKKLEEKIFTLDVARRLERLLAGEHWRVLLSRTDDRFVALPDRADFANAARADLFVSIHFNSVTGNPSVRGTETYVLTPQFQRSTSSDKASPEDKIAQPGNQHDLWSAVLGYHLHRELLARLKTEDRGYKRARFAVLRLVDCPAVLVEAGYLSNDGEAALLATEAYRARIAEAIYAGILAYDAALSAAGK